MKDMKPAGFLAPLILTRAPVEKVEEVDPHKEFEQRNWDHLLPPVVRKGCVRLSTEWGQELKNVYPAQDRNEPKAAEPLPQPEAGKGWIPWAGGECPVKDARSVWIMLDGNQETDPPMEIHDHASENCRIHWQQQCVPGSGLNIIAYRLAAQGD